jgi:hypothetical protein
MAAGVARLASRQDWRESVIPGLPHDITQRGNRRQQRFFNEGDWPWSSARANLADRDDQLFKVASLLEMISDWALSSTAPCPKKTQATSATLSAPAGHWETRHSWRAWRESSVGC